MTPRFDPTRAVVFDLAQGQLRDDEGSARLNLPASLVVRLCEGAGPAATRDLGRGLGTEIGRRIAKVLGDDVTKASADAWAEHLGGQLALLGFGDLSVERWARALVLRVTGHPAHAEALIAAVLEGVIQRGLGKDVEIVPCVDGGTVGFLVLAGATADRARRLAASGAGLGQIVDTLHRGGDS